MNNLFPQFDDKANDRGGNSAYGLNMGRLGDLAGFIPAEQSLGGFNERVAETRGMTVESA